MNAGPPRLDHPRQVVQGRVHVRAADRLDERAGHVVVLVAVPVVLHGRPVDGLLHRLQADLRLALGDGGARGRLQGGQGAPGVAAGDAQEVGLGVLRQGHGPAQSALAGEGPCHQPPQVLVGERLQGEEQRAGEERGDDREVGVLGGGGDERHPAVLHGGQQRVLLGLGEAVDLVEEEDGLLAVAADGAPGSVDDRPDLLDARGDRRQFHEPLVRRLGDDVREGGLSDARRTPEDHRGGAGGAAVPLAHEPAQRRSGLEQVLLPHHLVEGAGAHPDGQRAAGRVLLLPVFGCCGKEVGLHSHEA